MKEIPITEDMKKDIVRANNGDVPDFTQIAVFESRSLNTRPLRRNSGLFAHAVTDESVLHEMAAGLNHSNEGVPLHLMHNREALNVGKVFRARVDTATDGQKELSSQFYIPREFSDLVARFNTGAVDQVSVGIQAKEIKCSECGFDYRAGSVSNLMTLTCNKKHTIGEKGVHAKLHGLDSWMEMSAVDTGAASDARIVGADKSRFVAADTVYRLAANQNELQTSIPLIANLDELFSEEIPEVDEAKFQEMLTASLSAHDNAHKEAVATLTTELEAAQAELKETQDKLVEATKVDVVELQAQLDAATALNDKATAYLKEQAVKAQVATGVTAPVEPTDLEAAITAIDNSKVNLVNLFAKEGDKGKATTGLELNAKASGRDFSAFKAHKGE